MSKDSKKAFDFSRNTMWSVDPLDLCIIGGQCLPEDERGPNDTDDGDEHDLWDVRLLRPLKPEFVADIAANGVDTPVLIAKLNDVATVVVGRRRVRAARRANAERAANNEPLIKIDCKMKRSSTNALMGTMISENEGREDDDVPTKIRKFARLIDRGSSPEDAAQRFNVTPLVARGWLAYLDNATTETKKVVDQGRLSQSAAAVLGAIKDPAAQNKALQEMLATEARPSTRTARLALKRADKTKIVGINDKRTQRHLLQVIQNTVHRTSSEKSLARLEGAEEMLKLLLGEADEEIGAWLRDKRDEAVALYKTATREKQKAAEKKAAAKAEKQKATEKKAAAKAKKEAKKKDADEDADEDADVTEDTDADATVDADTETSVDKDTDTDTDDADENAS